MEELHVMDNDQRQCGLLHLWMIIVHYLMKMKVGCLCGITDMEMEWNGMYKQRCICRAFHFTGLRLSREVLHQV